MDEVARELRSDDPRIVARAYETAVLRGFGLDTAQVDDLAPVYRRLSERLLARGAAERSGGFQFDGDRARAVWALVYGWRTFARTRRLLAELGSTAGGFVEVGSGWGPAGLAAALQGASVLLVEPEEASTHATAALYESAGVAAPEIQIGDARRLTVSGASAIVAPYSLWEMCPPADAEESEASSIVRQWLSTLAPGGWVALLEAGTRAAARRLQALRDAVTADFGILGPCRGAPTCPKMQPPTEWCHFTWPMRPGPATRRLMDLAGRRWQEVHGSWLALSADQASWPTNEVRLLDVRLRGKAKIEAEVCGYEGLERVVALKRHRESYDLVSALRAGERLRLDRPAMTRKGDGLRLEAASGVEPIG